MVKVTFLTFDGDSYEAEIPPDQSLMEGAVKNGIPGIDADCGGACACATCHVYIDDAWTEKVGHCTELEIDMLGFAESFSDNSRLSCQVKISEDLDGLIVRLPESQR